MRNPVIIVLAVGSVLAGIGSLQAAPTEAQQQAIRSSCQNDYRSHCASVPTGGPEALQCLEKNVASLSPACQQAVKAASGGGAASTSGQSGGAATSGSASTSSSGAAAATPPAAAPAATPPAAAPAGKAKPPVIIVLEPGQEIAIMRKACAPDYRSYCSGVRVIGGGALSCLVSHAPSLSPGCKSVLSKLGQAF